MVCRSCLDFFNLGTHSLYLQLNSCLAFPTDLLLGCLFAAGMPRFCCFIKSEYRFSYERFSRLVFSPPNFKTAIVKPLLRYSFLDLNDWKLQDCIKVSIHIQSNWYNYCRSSEWSNRFKYVFQFSVIIHRPHQCTETALLNILSDLRTAFDNGSICLLTPLDTARSVFCHPYHRP